MAKKKEQETRRYQIEEVSPTRMWVRNKSFWRYIPIDVIAKTIEGLNSDGKVVSGVLRKQSKWSGYDYLIIMSKGGNKIEKERGIAEDYQKFWNMATQLADENKEKYSPLKNEDAREEMILKHLVGMLEMYAVRYGDLEEDFLEK